MRDIQLDLALASYAISLVFLALASLFIKLSRPKESLNWNWLAIFAILQSISFVYIIRDTGGQICYYVNLFLGFLALLSLFTMALQGAANTGIFRLNPKIGYSLIVVLFVFTAFGIWELIRPFLLALIFAWLGAILASRKSISNSRSMSYRLLSAAFFGASIVKMLIAGFSYSEHVLVWYYYIMCFLAILATFSLFSLARSYMLNIYDLDTGKLRLITVVVASIIVMFLVLYGLSYVDFTEENTIEQIHHDLEYKMSLLSYEFSFENSFSTAIAISIASSQQVRDCMVDSTGCGEANILLDETRNLYNNSVIYVMDTDGITQLSTNRNQQDSFIGKNYSFRPYFIDALNGRQGLYMARGVTSGLRGLYYSAPVLAGSVVKGVVVVKTNAQNMNSRFDHFDNAHLLSPEGLIFMTSNDEWLYHFIGEPATADEGKVISSSQYGIEKANYLDFTFTDDFMVNSNQSYIYSQNAVDPEGWSVIVMQDTDQVVSSRMSVLLWVVLILIVLFLIFMFLFHYHIDDKRTKVSEANFQDVFENVNDMIIRLSTDFKVMYANPSAASALDKPLNKKFLSFLRKSQKNKFMHAIKESQHQDRAVKVRFLLKAHKEILVEGNLHCRIEKGNPLFYTLLLQDITLREKTEKQNLKRQKELEWINQITIGRELKMVELKNKIKDLQNKLGGKVR